VITDEEAMRLFEQADPARIDDPVPFLDAASYLEVIAAPTTNPTSLGEAASRRRWSRVVAAAAIAVVLVTGGVVLALSRDDTANVVVPAGSAPAPAGPDGEATLDPPAPRPPLPDGLTGLPPEGAPPSTPATGQLVAPLPIPIWVYEDGRVISARWTTHRSWTGFLEQRLTPEGVELVRAEILALEPLDNCLGGLGNYGYVDGSRDLCESPGGPTSLYVQHPQYQRLSELQYGAPSWLPASAWADPEPKPFVPSTYQITISTISDFPAQPWRAPSIDSTAMLAALPPVAAGQLTSAAPCPDHFFKHSTGQASVCFTVTTEAAQHFGTAVGVTEGRTSWITLGGPPVAGDGGNPAGVFARYLIQFDPYLPHQAPVACCMG
jgi:hypothetical protein